MKLITILGPTAVGKTRLAVELAFDIRGEIISADSRQVYKGMDLGTGKDLKEYKVNGRKIPYHLIDILDAGEEYDVFRFQGDFYKVYSEIIGYDHIPILCGGSGLYLQAALADNKMQKVPVNQSLRKKLEGESQAELNTILQSLNPEIHNTTDLKQRDRTIRAIEIAEFNKRGNESIPSPVSEKIVFGLHMERDKLRKRIKDRLEGRIKAGMIEEVENLIKQGLSIEKLNYYGLEYRFISRYLNSELNYDEMFEALLQAIRKFAKKQMTWFRRMEKQGERIIWLKADEPLQSNLSFIKEELGG